MNLNELLTATAGKVPAQHILIYGDAKVGKTELAGSLAAKYKVLWIDIENGWRSLMKLPAEMQKNIEMLIIPDTRVYPIAAPVLLDLIKGGVTKLCALHSALNCPVCSAAVMAARIKKIEEPIFNTYELNKLHPDEWVVVLDSASQFSNSIMSHLCRAKADDYKPDWDDFRVQGALLDRFFSQVQQAPFNFVTTALTVAATGEDKVEKISPFIGTTNYSRNVAKYFDHAIYCEMKGKKHAFGSKTTYSLAALTGSRTDVLIEAQDTSADRRASLLPFFEASREAAVSTFVSPSLQSSPTQNQATKAVLLSSLNVAKNL